MVKDIGRRIIDLRESKNWSQREFADRLGLNASVMNRIESGERPIKDFELANIAGVLNTTSDYLLGRENVGENNNLSSDVKKIAGILSIMDSFFKDMNNFKYITLDDIEKIKNHIDFVLYQAKGRKK